MNMPLYFYESLSPSTGVPMQRLCNQRQPNPHVGLTTPHGSLSKEDQMTPLPRGVIQQFHQLDTVPSNGVA
jgi:hypothetical protein